MCGQEGPILGKEKAALPGAAEEEQSVRSQRPQSHRSRSAERAQIAMQRERMARKIQRSTKRVRGAGFGRRPLLEAVA
jgi:hypothetical protein